MEEIEMTLKTGLENGHDFMVVIDTNCFENYSETNSIIPYIASDKCHTFFSDKKNREGISFGEYYITESVFREIIQQRIENYTKTKESAKKINITVNIPVLPDFEKELKDYLEKYNIKILPHPNNDVFPDIIDRALKKKLPFKNTGSASDKGFKDVLLWETLLNYDYEKHRICKLFFITANEKDFPMKELLPEWKQRHPNVELQIFNNWDEFILEEKCIFPEIFAKNSIHYLRVLEAFQEENPDIIKLLNLTKKIIARKNSSVVEIFTDVQKKDGTVYEDKYYYDIRINDVTLIDPDEENKEDIE